jgi:hypothetical protein
MPDDAHLIEERIEGKTPFAGVACCAWRWIGFDCRTVANRSAS